MSRGRFALVSSIMLLAGCGERQLTAPERRVPDNASAVLLEPGTVTQISAGDGHSCALKTDGAVVCWGWNYFGQATPPAGTFTQVSAGGDHSCALTASGTIACWGAATSSRSPPAGTFTQISAGTLHSCALAPSGAVVCWGDNRYGQAAPPAGTFTQVSAGGEHSCALTTAGTLVCWGNTHGESSTGTYTQVSAGEYHTCAVATDGTLACWGAATPTPPTGTFTQVAAGRGHSCALRADGTVACWGENRYGQATPPSGTFTQVEAGGSHSCGMRTDGSIACWGANDAGLSVGWPWFASYAGAGPPTGSFTDVSTSGMQVCAIRSGGAMVCWGWNREGQSASPAGSYARVSLGGDRSCALTTEGGLVCWGQRLSWDMPTSGRFTQLSVSADHACVVAVGGAITCWGGQNRYGEATSPAGTFTQVSTGALHTCAIRSTGELACWGNNSDGQATPPAGTFTQVSAGWTHSCALRPNGGIACWGDDSHGESTPPAGTFTQVRAGSGGTCALDTAGAAVCWGDGPTPPSRRFTRLSTGLPTCGIELDQSLACWGNSAFAESPAPPNRAPAALPGGPYTGTEGALVTLSLTGTDIDGNTLAYSWDLGDGTTGEGAAPPASHVYADDGAYTIRLTVDDGHGGVDTKTTTATIANVAPSIPQPGGLTGPSSPIQLVAGSAGAAITLRFTDPAGARDSYAARIDCGNGTVLAPTGISSPLATTCTYAAAGVYAVSATVSDEDGGTSAVALFQYVVVYEPGGDLATGSGRFTSSPSACPTLCGSATNSASFTFNARFLPGGTTTPDGSATFLLQGDRSTRWRRSRVLEFHSTSIEMLIVSSGRAQLWGTGAMNGAPGYTFRITAVDAGTGRAADAFRIEISDPSRALVYDNQWGAPPDAALTVPIESGQITIHRRWGRSDR